MNNFLDFETVRIEYDENGLRQKAWNIGENGNIKSSAQRKVAGVITTWDVINLDEKSIVWVDVNGKPKNLSPFEVSKGNHGFSKETYEHDMFGYTTGFIQEKANGELITTTQTEGEANVFSRVIFDFFGFLIDVRFFDLKGLPTENASGIARVELIRNEGRFLTEVRKYNLKGELANSRADGIAVIKLEYSKEGEVIGSTRLDKDGVEIKRER